MVGIANSEPRSRPPKTKNDHLNPKYKEKVSQELDKLLEASIIELVEESDWVSLTVV